MPSGDSDSVTELKTLFRKNYPEPSQDVSLRETLTMQAETIQRQEAELRALRAQVGELMRDRQKEAAPVHRAAPTAPVSVDGDFTNHLRGGSPQRETYRNPRGATDHGDFMPARCDFDASTLAQPSPASHQPHATDEGSIVKLLSDQLTLSRLPIVEPRVFSGKDPLYFPKWKIEFETLIHHRAIPPAERLHYLTKYLGGEAKEAVEGFLYMRTPDAYDRAYNLLNRRYGDNSELAASFRQKLRTWPKIGPTDTQGLRKFVDFLRQCLAAITSSNLYTLEVLNDEAENVEMIKRLPQWLSRGWARRVTAHRIATGAFPPFKDFVSFLTDEDDIANDPISKAIQSSSAGAENRRGGSRTFATETRERPSYHCAFCGEAHLLLNCEEFRTRSYEERRRVVQERGLCFGCLSQGHLSRSCGNRRTCDACGRWHPTALHPDRLNFPTGAGEGGGNQSRANGADPSSR